MAKHLKRNSVQVRDLKKTKDKKKKRKTRSAEQYMIDEEDPIVPTRKFYFYKVHGNKLFKREIAINPYMLLGIPTTGAQNKRFDQHYVDSLVRNIIGVTSKNNYI